MTRWSAGEVGVRDSASRFDHGVNLGAVTVRLAYDGTHFCGWQRQGTGVRTVQGELEDALARMLGRAVRTRGASRTDAGVHAMGQVVSFDAPVAIDDRGWLRGLNRELPHDVAVRHVMRGATGYDPRHDATGKRYEYLVCLDRVRNPLLRHRAWHLGPGMHWRVHGEALDLTSMAQAGEHLLGTHDFSCFQATGDDRTDTVRTLTRVNWQREGPLLRVTVQGTAFLKYMVRNLVGTLVEVGRQRLRPGAIPSLLEGGDRRRAGPTAPAHGLCLQEVFLGRR